MNISDLFIEVELYFSNMPLPLKVRLTPNELRELDKHGRRCVLPDGPTIYKHPEQPNSCAACFFSTEPASRQFEWKRFVVEDSLRHELTARLLR